MAAGQERWAKALAVHGTYGCLRDTVVGLNVWALSDHSVSRGAGVRYPSHWQTWM